MTEIVPADDKPSDDEILAALESTLATEELQAFLSEWMLTNTQRITAFSLVLRHWLKMMMADDGFGRDSIEGTLPLMIERLWPHEHTMNFTGGMSDDDDDDDDDEDGDN